jgi:hypothetical protein
VFINEINQGSYGCGSQFKLAFVYVFKYIVRGVMKIKVAL